jgi:hypothetical protein
VALVVLVYLDFLERLVILVFLASQGLVVLQVYLDILATQELAGIQAIVASLATLERLEYQATLVVVCLGTAGLAVSLATQAHLGLVVK